MCIRDSTLTVDLSAYAAKADPTFTGTIYGANMVLNLGTVSGTSFASLLAPYQKSLVVTTTTASPLTLTNNTLTVDLSAYATTANPTFTGIVAGVSKAAVGLGSVDNTTDASKPISTATQNALDAKAPIASPTFTGIVAGVTQSMVGLSNVNNTTDALKPISTATLNALALLAPLASPTFTGTVTQEDLKLQLDLET